MILFKSGKNKFRKIKDKLKNEIKEARNRLNKLYFDPFEEEDRDISFSYTLPNYFKIGLLTNTLFSKASALVSLKKSISFLIDEKVKQNRNDLLQLNAVNFVSFLHPLKVKLFLIDAENYGKSFAYLNELSDDIKGEKILDEPSEIKKKLTEIERRISYINQEILSYRYPSLNQYNNENKKNSEAFYLLFIANFPYGFDNETVQKLVKIIKNGYEAGVVVFLTINKEAAKQKNIDIKEILENTIVLNESLKIISTKDPSKDYFNQILNIQTLDFSFYKEKIPSIIKRVNQKIENLKNAKINLDDVLTKENLWTKDSSKSLQIPIGQKRNGEIFNLVLNSLTPDFSALIAGTTGSGKSYLLHNIIINTSHLYSPDELRFYLLDFKEGGIEFRKYINLPHLEILSLVSKKEFAKSVFEKISKIVEERAKLFSKVGATNISEYREKTKEKMHKILLIIDEFQEMLKEPPSKRIDDDVEEIKSYLSKLAAKYRAYGIHCILSTQTYRDVNLPENVEPNITVKMALEMTREEGLKFINNEDVVNLKQAEVIYNKKSEYTYFKVAYLPKERLEERIEQYKNISDFKYQPFKKYISDFSQEISVKSNKKLMEMIERDSFTKEDDFCECYIGEPISLEEEHKSFRLEKIENSNVAIIGQDMDSVLSIFAISAYQIIKNQYGNIYLFDLFGKRSKYYGKLEFLNEIFPSNQLKIYNLDNFREIIKLINKNFQNKTLDKEAVIMILNASSLKLPDKFQRDEDDPFFELLSKGSKEGVHFIIHSQKYNFFHQYLDADYFDTKIALKGEDSYKLVYESAYEDMMIKENSKALIRSINSDFERQSAMIYSFSSVKSVIKGD